MSKKCDATPTFHSCLQNLHVLRVALEFWEASVPVPANVLMHVLSCSSQHKKKKSRSGGLEELMFYTFKQSFERIYVFYGNV